LSRAYDAYTAAKKVFKRKLKLSAVGPAPENEVDELNAPVEPTGP